MSMAASVVSYTVDQANAEELVKSVGEHVVPAARQTAGYRGFMLLDQGEGKRLAILIYDSVEDVQAAQRALGPVGRGHTYGLMSGPAVGSAASIVIADGLFAERP